VFSQKRLKLFVVEELGQAWHFSEEAAITGGVVEQHVTCRPAFYDQLDDVTELLKDPLLAASGDEGPWTSMHLAVVVSSSRPHCLHLPSKPTST
jgi:hypothetical protein